MMTLLCSLLHSAKPSSNINRYAPKIRLWPLISTPDLDPDLWPWPLPLTLTLKQGSSEVKTRFLAFDLDLRLTTLTIQTRSSSTPIPKIKFDGQTIQPREDGRYQVHYLLKPSSHTVAQKYEMTCIIVASMVLVGSHWEEFRINAMILICIGHWSKESCI